MTDLLREQAILEREGYLYRSLKEVKHRDSGKNSDPLSVTDEKSYPEEDAAWEAQKEEWRGVEELEAWIYRDRPSGMTEEERIQFEFDEKLRRAFYG